MSEFVYPIFAFARRQDIELEAGFILAGQLVVEIPKGADDDRQRSIVADIIRMLTERAKSGEMSKDAMIYAWPGNHRPANAVDTDDDEAMQAWADKSLRVIVRVGEKRTEDPDDPRSDGVRLDSDLMRQAGLIPATNNRRQ
jgi:hypothetical protein